MNLIKELLESQYSHLIEIAQIGHFSDYVIHVYSGERTIAHFHYDKMPDYKLLKQSI